jgi:hypothetical protein
LLSARGHRVLRLLEQIVDMGRFVRIFAHSFYGHVGLFDKHFDRNTQKEQEILAIAETKSKRNKQGVHLSTCSPKSPSLLHVVDYRLLFFS